MTPPASDRGQAAGFEMWAIGILVFVAGTLLVAQAWATLNARSSAGQMAQEYLRAYSESSTHLEATDSADRALRSVASARHVIAYRVTPPTQFGPCQLVAVTVAIDLPAMRIPFVGSWGEHTVTATRRELTDPYRSIDAEQDEGTSDVATPCD